MKLSNSVYFVTILGSLIVSSCATTGYQTRTGYSLYGDVSEPVTATNIKASSKTGRACTTNVLGFIASGDASIEAAKKDGGVTEVSSVDTETSHLLGIYGKVCTIVTGN